MLRNKTKQKVREGKAVLGCGLEVDHPYSLEHMAEAGFDFLHIDMQHSPIGPEGLNRMIMGLTRTESEIIVRVIWNDIHIINQALDLGADGVVVPMTNTKADFERAIEAARYPPKGKRSWAPRRTERYGGIDEYTRTANDEIIVWPQIETIEAVNNLDDILKVEGLDGVMIGPADMGMSMGYSPLTISPAVDEAMGHTLKKCREYGVPCGIFTGSIDTARAWIKRGGLMANMGLDNAFLFDGVDKLASDASALLAEVNGQ